MDLSFTSTDVVSSLTTLLTHNAGVTISAGDSIYLDSSDIWQLADCSALRNIFGIALNGGAVGQQINCAIKGTIDFGISLLQGQLYVISTNSGKIAPISDLVTGNYTHILGYANNSNELIMRKSSISYALG